MRCGALLLSLWLGPMVDGHVHKAPHGGVIAHAGPYHVEMFVSEDAIRVWILDDKEKVVPPPAGSALTLTVERESSNLEDKQLVRTVLPLKLAADRFETPIAFETPRLVA